MVAQGCRARIRPVAVQHGHPSCPGPGVPGDFPEAVRWHRKAAEQGFAPAQSQLGSHYADGLGVPQDDIEASRWHRKSVERSTSKAIVRPDDMSAKLSGVFATAPMDLEWLLNAAEQGSPTAQTSLAFKYSDGAGVRQDDAEAARWFTRAAEQGFAPAQLMLGVKYANGDGVPRNDVLAYQWLLLAGVQDETVRRMVGDVEKRLTPEQRKAVQERAKDFRAARP